jgi:hydroxymethylpyrimidine pyrophosphatase-like HAD family hydrolase
MEMDVALVVTDLDGCMWHTDSEVHPRTREAVAALDASRVPFLVATGRRVRSTRAPLQRLGIAPPAVVLNGSLGLDLATGERFHQGGYTAPEAAIVLSVFRAHGMDPCVYVDHDDYSVWTSSTPATHPEHFASFGIDVRHGDLLEVVDVERVLAFSVLGIDEPTARAVGEALAAVSSVHVDRDRSYGGYAVTVAPPHQSKWDGVAAFCLQHELDAASVLAIGDGPNDVALLDNAAIAVVPEDAHPSARAHADHVVGCARDGGWAEILELIGL